MLVSRGQVSYRHLSILPPKQKPPSSINKHSKHVTSIDGWIGFKKNLLTSWMAALHGSSMLSIMTGKYSEIIIAITWPVWRGSIRRSNLVSYLLGGGDDNALKRHSQDYIFTFGSSLVTIASCRDQSPSSISKAYLNHPDDLTKKETLFQSGPWVIEEEKKDLFLCSLSGINDWAVF